MDTNLTAQPLPPPPPPPPAQQEEQQPVVVVVVEPDNAAVGVSPSPAPLPPDTGGTTTDATMASSSIETTVASAAGGFGDGGSDHSVVDDHHDHGLPPPLPSAVAERGGGGEGQGNLDANASSTTTEQQQQQQQPPPSLQSLLQISNNNNNSSDDWANQETTTLTTSSSTSMSKMFSTINMEQYDSSTSATTTATTPFDDGTNAGGVNTGNNSNMDFFVQNSTSSANLNDTGGWGPEMANLVPVNHQLQHLHHHGIDGDYGSDDDNGTSSSSWAEDLKASIDYGHYANINGHHNHQSANLMEARQNGIANANQQEMEAAWSGFFLGAAIANVLILAFFLLITRGKRGYFGIRLYTVNLTIFALLQILLLAWAQPNDCFGMAKITPFSVQNFFNKYNAQLMEWSQVVYLSCTTVLILDSIQRFRGNGAGIGNLRWVLAVLFSDAFPAVYIFVKGIWFEVINIHPKPLAIYHATVLATFMLCATLLKLVVCCVPIVRFCGTRASQEATVVADCTRVHALREKMLTNRLTTAPMPKSFTLCKLALLLAFVMFTGWTQYTVFNLSTDLHPGDLDEGSDEFITMSNHEGVHRLLQIINKEHLMHTVMSIQQWAALVRPFLETLFALLFLLIPSIGRKFQMRKIEPRQQNANGHNANASGGNLNNDQLIAAGLFSRPMTASGHLAATAPPMAAVRM